MVRCRVYARGVWCDDRCPQVVTLCGGSGAELLAFAAHCDHVCGTALRQTDSSAPLPRLRVTVVDVHASWRGTIAEYTRLIRRHCKHIAVDVIFRRCDLLVPAQVHAVARTVVRGAHVVTCVYGLSELYDLHPAGARAALAAVAAAMDARALLLVADPLSLAHGGAKPAWVRSTVSRAREGVSLVVNRHVKVRVPAALFATPLASTAVPPTAAGTEDQPALHTLYATLGLRVGHDVKVFTNSWCHLYAFHTSAAAELLGVANSARESERMVL